MTLGDLDAICSRFPGTDSVSVASADYYSLAASFSVDANGRTIYQAKMGPGLTRPVEISVDPNTAVGSAEGE